MCQWWMIFDVTTRFGAVAYIYGDEHRAAVAIDQMMLARGGILDYLPCAAPFGAAF